MLAVPNISFVYLFVCVYSLLYKYGNIAPIRNKTTALFETFI